MWKKVGDKWYLPRGRYIAIAASTEHHGLSAGSWKIIALQGLISQTVARGTALGVEEAKNNAERALEGLA